MRHAVHPLSRVWWVGDRPQEEGMFDCVALTAAALRALQLDRCRGSLGFPFLSVPL